MAKGPFSVQDQALELSQLVTLERIRLRRKAALPVDLIEQGLQSEQAKRIARALGGERPMEQLSDQEQRWFNQVRVLAGG